MKRTDAETSSRWVPPRWYGWFAWILLAPAAVVLLIDVALERWMTWPSVGRALSGVSALGLIVISRMVTRVTANGIETSGCWARTLPNFLGAGERPSAPQAEPVG